MTTGSVAPAEIENPKSHLKGTRAFAPDAAALGAELLAGAGVQLARATAAAPFSSVRRPILVVIALSPDRPSRIARRGLSTRDAERTRRDGQEGLGAAPPGGLGATLRGRAARQTESVRLRY